jgi:hypothetical protein
MLHEARESVTWLNANKVGSEFFSKEDRLLRETHLKTVGSPFFYNLIKSKLKNNVDEGNDTEDKDDNETGSFVDFEENTCKYGDVNKATLNERRAHSVSE